MNYVDGYLLAVPSDKKDAYKAFAEKSWPMFKEWGAVRHVECWSDDVPHGHTTDFFRAVKAIDGESVVFSWIEYPSKEARDAAGKKMREDPRMKEWGEAMNFVDGKRMVFGGFTPIMDKRAQGECGLVPINDIALIEPFDLSENSDFKPVKAFRARIVMPNRDTVW